MHHRRIMIFNTYYNYLFMWIYLHECIVFTHVQEWYYVQANAHTNGSSPYGFSVHPLQREAPSACLVHEGANRRRLRCHGRLIYYFSTMGFISITSPIWGIFTFILHVFLPNHLKLIKVRYAEWRHPLRHISFKIGRWDNDLGAQRTSPSTEDLRRDALLALPNPVVKVMMLEWLWPAKKQQMQLFITNDLVCRMCV